VHPVRQVRAGLPARRDPPQGVRARRARGRARHVRVGRRALQGVPRHALHPAGRAGGLHRLHIVRRGLPGQGQAPAEPQGDQHGAAAAAARARARQLGLLPGAARRAAHAGEHARDQERAAARAAVRVLGRLRRLRRDTLHQARVAALRRPGADRQRDWLLVDLRRQPAHHPLDDQQRGATRCSRTTPSSALACGSPSTSSASRPRRCSRS
jgi:hypothetical protein